MKKLLLLTTFIFFSSSWTMAQSSYEPPSGMSEIQAYSIFYENYKSESYESAVQFGRWIWKGMPETLKGYSKFDLKRNLRRLIKSYSNLAQNATDPSAGKAYADTALIIFDKVQKKYGSNLDTATWALLKGRFYQSNSQYIENSSAKAAAEYQKAFEANPEKFTKMADGYYVQAMLQSLVKAEKKDQALVIMDKAEPYASDQLKDYFSSVKNDLFDSPDERIAFLKEELKDDPKNEKLLNQLRDVYENQEMVAELNEVNKKLYEINPSYENALALGESAMSDARYNKAIKYLKVALEKADEDEEKAAIALNLSSTYRNTGRLQSARRYARIASDNDPDNGKPYIYIADAYAQAVSQCTDNRKMETEDRVVYWLVLDYLSKAKRVDSSVSNEANRKIQAYAPVTPSREKQFFKNWSKGQSLRVDSSLGSCYGWIGETTTVR